MFTQCLGSISDQGSVWQVHLRGLQSSRHRQPAPGPLREPDGHLPPSLRQHQPGVNAIKLFLP
jgi:hypothetical protein